MTWSEASELRSMDSTKSQPASTTVACRCVASQPCDTVEPVRTLRTSAPGGVRMASPTIRVRSYNVGFGDCFLVTVPDGSQTRHMLVDFGNAPGLLNTNYPAIAENIKEETGSHLDLVVMTHEHLDHLEGFYDQ